MINQRIRPPPPPPPLPPRKNGRGFQPSPDGCRNRQDFFIPRRGCLFLENSTSHCNFICPSCTRHYPCSNFLNNDASQSMGSSSSAYDGSNYSAISAPVNGRSGFNRCPNVFESRISQPHHTSTSSLPSCNCPYFSSSASMQNIPMQTSFHQASSITRATQHHIINHMTPFSHADQFRETLRIPNAPPPPPPIVCRRSPQNIPPRLLPNIPPPNVSYVSTQSRQSEPPVSTARSLQPKPSHLLNLAMRNQINHDAKPSSSNDLSNELTITTGMSSLRVTPRPQLSPLPKLRNYDDSSRINESKLSGHKVHERCSAAAYMRFMEQHYESAFKYLQERADRRIKFEYECTTQNLGKTHDELRKLLNKKESIELRNKRKKMNRNNFHFIQLVGRGVIGEVSLVKSLFHDEVYAMKTIKKSEVLKRSEMCRVYAERDSLAEADSVWIVKLFYSFQDHQNLYFVMEYVPGGDLMTLLQRQEIFDENDARFYIAEISIAVQYVHSRGFVHRDIKPDNILIDGKGHIKLGDFGQSTGFRWQHDRDYYLDREKEKPDEENQSAPFPFCSDNPTLSQPLEQRRLQQGLKHSYSLVGSTHYMAPEVLSKGGLNVPTSAKAQQMSDWWSVGVIFYEMIYGRCPFWSDNPDENENREQNVQYRIINFKEYLKLPNKVFHKNAYKEISVEAKDLILRLMDYVDQRLCQNGISDLMEHPFFINDLNWEDVLNRKLEPPFKPSIKDKLDTSNFPLDDIPPIYEYNTENAKKNLEINQPYSEFYEFTYKLWEAETDDTSLSHELKPPKSGCKLTNQDQLTSLSRS